MQTELALCGQREPQGMHTRLLFINSNCSHIICQRHVSYLSLGSTRGFSFRSRGSTRHRLNGNRFCFDQQAERSQMINLAHLVLNSSKRWRKIVQQYCTLCGEIQNFLRDITCKKKKWEVESGMTNIRNGRQKFPL